MNRNAALCIMIPVLLLILCLAAVPCHAQAGQPAPLALSAQWWFWPLLLGLFSFFIGLLAVFAGIGGGVLFVPLTSAFFPFHLDFVRGTGLLIALAGALAACPSLLRANLAHLRLGLPPALVASTCSIVGACLGLALPAAVVRISLGCLILGVAGLTYASRSALHPAVTRQDGLALALGMHGMFTEPATGACLPWQAQRTALGLFLFCFIGVAAGMFGLGAGWANVPVLNLVMAAPFKMAVGTSTLVLSITDTSAVWIYLYEGCILPLMAVPAVLGLMSGALLGVRLMVKTRPERIRLVVIAMLVLAGARSLLSGVMHYL